MCCTEMNARVTVWWFIVVAIIIKNFSRPEPSLFQLLETQLTATEGSCAEIKCKVTYWVDDRDAHWFWMKDAIWFDDAFRNATYIYSSDHTKQPVSADFKERVKYVGSPSSTWKNYASPTSAKLCSILICNLTKADSGNYSFRFIGLNKNRWHTKPELNLTVAENPCPITFEKPKGIIKESALITLTCSTLKSCHENIQIEDLTQPSSTWQVESGHREQKSSTVSFTAVWQDDEKTISCQTEHNKDTNLIQNISLAIQYAPKNVCAEVRPATIRKGDLVTLSCSAKGRPALKFAWFKKNNSEQEMSTEAEWNISSIEISESGEYHCKAQNEHGTAASNSVTIDVEYEPQVTAEMDPHASVVRQGDSVAFTCNVVRSNPQPHTFSWSKNGHHIVLWRRQYVKRIEPDDSGSYTCSATNSVGTGTSKSLQITVHYSPRKTKISSYPNNRVKLGTSLTLYCDTDATPPALNYFWYRYYENKRIDSSQWKSKTATHKMLRLDRVQRSDEACYMCNASNILATGDNSRPVCIQVLYPPTNTMLSMDTEVKEGQLITISCTAESSPPSQLTLTRTSTSNPAISDEPFKTPEINQRNTLQHTFRVTSAHAGIYTCSASNSEGLGQSPQRKLVVKYHPKDVKVRPNPGFVVNENTMLTLDCIASSHPAVTSVTWTKVTDGKSKTIQKSLNLKLKPVGPSDSGLYRCEATNEIGTGISQQVEVKVKYAPKHTSLTKVAEQQHDGKSSVTLSCSSQSYPPVTQYSWYRKAKDGETDINVIGNSQNYTVRSDQPGAYYCIAHNEINQGTSDPVELFVDRRLMMALRFFFLVLIILLVIVVIVLVYRHKRNKSIHQGTTNTSPCVGFLAWWGCARRRNLMSEPVMAEPSRSRDDLLPDQPFHPRAQRQQPHPDSTPASNINSVYCTVNLPTGKQAPYAQKTTGQQGGHTKDESLNYASLHFGKNKQPKGKENAVYAVVEKPTKKTEQERLEDYENVGPARAAKSPDPLIYDTDTSEDEVELNYAKVSFKAKSGHQRGDRDSSSDTSSDSSTSDGEDTQYSQVKI